MSKDLEPLDENLVLYVEESNEYLSGIETDLLEIESKGEVVDPEVINRVFRAAHTIKGGAGFFYLKNIKTLGHKIENILDLIRSKEIIPTSEAINILLIAFDKLHGMVNNVQQSNDEDISEILESLVTLLNSEVKDISIKENIDKLISIKDQEGNIKFNILAVDYGHIVNNDLLLYLIEIDFIEDLHMKGRGPLDLYREMNGTGTVEASSLDIESLGTLDKEFYNMPYFILFSTKIKPKKISKLFDVTENKIFQIEEVYPFEDKPSDSESPKVKNREIKEPKTDIKPEIENSNFIESITTDKVSAAGSLRVKVELLEQLMVLAGELVLSRNQLNESIISGDKKRLSSSGQRISLVTSEIQEAIMMTRLQNVGSIFNKFPRLVRDMSNQLNKKIELKIFGGEVELDKTIIEGLNDPLTHMIRNSIDHGIESSEDRVKSGKSKIGTIQLKASHEAGQVIIEVTDDGKGLDLDKIVKKAIVTGCITSEEAQNMSSKQKALLIFNPGLSTAESVTDVSGRGVGMDVVKSKLDELGGVVDIKTVEGKGSVFKIKLPLTLAIIPSLLVLIDEERFAIPQVNIEELIKISHEDIYTKVKKIGWIDALDLRGELIPLVMLDKILGISTKYIDPVTGESKLENRACLSDRREKNINSQLDNGNFKDDLVVERKSDRRKTRGSDVNIVIVSNGNYKYGLVVEELADNLEIVVKPLGRHLSQCKEYAGATIMGDGKVALIIDVGGIANILDLQSIKAAELDDDKDGYESELQSYITFKSSKTEHCAIPMQLVTRVEHIVPEQLEYIGAKRVMKYRDKTLPVVALQDVAECKPIEEGMDLSVIVTSIYGREVGLLAVRPIDTINRDLVVDTETLKQKGILGSSIINEKTTMIVDIFEMIELLNPDIENKYQFETLDGDSPLVFIAEDSSFFRSQLENFVAQSGYRVITAEDGQDAWGKLQNSEEIPSIIITDIEMPRMNGYELTRRVRADSRLKDITVIAVTSLAGDGDREMGLKSGVTEYHVKLDKESLLESIKKYIKLIPQPGNRRNKL